MIVKEQSDGVGFEQPPEGTHIARCVRLIDIGTQTDEYQGKIKTRRQVIIGWELPGELMGEGDYAGQPFMTSAFYTMSLDERANLRRDLSNWRGRDFSEEELEGFDLKNILGHLCQVALTKNAKGRMKVTGVFALPKMIDQNSPDLAQVNPSLIFDLDDFSDEVYDSLSDGYKRMINDSPEYRMIMNERDTAIKHQDLAHEPDGEDMAAMSASESDDEPVDDDDEIPW